MLIYIIFILFSVCVFFVSMHVKNKTLSFFLILFTILPLSILEGFRDKNVGVDISVYGLDYFNYTLSLHSVNNIFNNEFAFDKGYLLLNYLCSSVSNNFNFFLFSSAVLKLSLVIYTLYTFRRNLDASLTLCCYLLFFYVAGFCLMRQSLAISFCIFSVPFFLTKKNILALIICIVAYFFHSSSVIFIFVLLSLYFVKIKIPFFYYVVIFVGIYVFSTVILSYIDGLDVLREGAVERYSDSGVNISKSNTLIILVSLFMQLYYYRKKDQIGDEMYRFLLFNNLFGLTLSYMASQFEVAFRLAYYPFIITLIFTPYQLYRLKAQKTLFVFVLTFFIHFYITALHGFGGAIPYTSKILGI